MHSGNIILDFDIAGLLALGLCSHFVEIIHVNSNLFYHKILSQLNILMKRVCLTSQECEKFNFFSNKYKYVYVVYEKRGRVVPPCETTRSSLNQTKCTWAPTERCCSSVEVVLAERSAALPGFARILKACPRGVDVDGND